MLTYTDDDRTDSKTIEELQQFLELAQEALYTNAKYCADRFWQNHLQLEKDSAEKPSSLGCRIRRKGDSVYMEWYYNIWSKKLGGGSKPRSRYIVKPGRGYHYNLAKLYSRAPEWEHEMIKETESAFANLREQNHHLTTIRRNWRSLSELVMSWEKIVSNDSDGKSFI